MEVEYTRILGKSLLPISFVAEFVNNMWWWSNFLPFLPLSELPEKLYLISFTYAVADIWHCTKTMILGQPVSFSFMLPILNVHKVSFPVRIVQQNKNYSPQEGSIGLGTAHCEWKTYLIQVRKEQLLLLAIAAIFHNRDWSECKIIRASSGHRMHNSY